MYIHNYILWPCMCADTYIVIEQPLSSHPSLFRCHIFDLAHITACAIRKTTVEALHSKPVQGSGKC